MATIPLLTSRHGHAATLLRDGRVLLTGGGRVEPAPSGPCDPTNPGSLSSAEVWDPATGKSSPVAAMSERRQEHAAVVLGDGRVMVVAGLLDIVCYRTLGTAEIWDPDAGSWGEGPALRPERLGHSLTLLSDERLLAAGGMEEEGLLGRCDISEPAVGWREAGHMQTPRYGHTAAALRDGRLLVVGGYGVSEIGPLIVLGCAEIWEPETETWRSVGALERPRADSTATPLSNGCVLVAGGVDDEMQPLSSVELWEPQSGHWSPVAPLSKARAAHTASLTMDGRVLVVGGCDSAQPLTPGALAATREVEAWDPNLDAWDRLPDLSEPRVGHTATLLADGRLFVAGGRDGARVHMSAELYPP